MPISIKIESLGCRIFEDDKSAENHDPYCGVGSFEIFWDVAIGRRFHGKMSKKDMREIVIKAKELGCKWFLARRLEGHRLPKGEVLESGPFTGWHCVDLTKIEV